MQLERKRIIETIPFFEEHYHFANKEDMAKVNAFITQLPVLTSVRLDLSKFPIWNEIKDLSDMQQGNEIVWICFLCGSKELIEIMPYGELGHFVIDFTAWQEISSYLLLVFDNLNDFIFIDDDGSCVRSCLYDNIK